MIPGSLVTPAISGYPFPTTALVAGWNFDEQTGTTVADQSGNGNTGTLSTSALWDSAGIVNGCVESDGSGYVTGPGSGNAVGIPLTGFGYAAWIYMPAGIPTGYFSTFGFNTSGSVAADNRGFAFGYLNAKGTGDQLYVCVRSSTTSTTGDYFRGFWTTGLTMEVGWNFVIANRDANGAYARIYRPSGMVDATLVVGLGTFTTSASQDMIFGSDSVSGSPVAPANGVRMDAVYIKGSPWASSEMTALYNDGLGNQK